MKRVLSFLLCVATAMAMLSCEDNTSGVRNMTLKCKTEGFVNEQESTKAYWGEDEQIYLYRSEDWSIALMSQNSGAGGSSATFSGKIADSKQGFYAVRPYTAAGAVRMDGSLSIDIAPNNIFLADENSSVVVPQVGTGNSGGLTFKSLFGAVKIPIVGPTSLSQIQASLPGEERGMHGSFDYNFKRGTLIGYNVKYALTRTFEQPVDISADGAIYVALLPGSYSKIELLLQSGADGTRYVCTVEDITIQKGRLIEATDAKCSAVASVVGSWRIKSFCGADAPVDLYIDFKINQRFTILQRTELAGYKLYEGVYTVDAENSTISGEYYDGSSWNDSYRFSMNENRELVLESLSTPSEVTIYESVEMPDIDDINLAKMAVGNNVKPL